MKISGEKGNELNCNQIIQNLWMEGLGMDTKEELISLYREMYELTEPECRCSCRLPRSCCAPEHCEFAAAVTKELWDEDINPQRTGSEIPFMGENGCVLEPHLRPNCTLHTCDINAFGFKMHPALDSEWDKKYWALRERINELTWQMQEEKDGRRISE